MTGTFWATSARADSMTEEEKERSAEELMGLIERLNRTGIIRMELGKK